MLEQPLAGTVPLRGTGYGPGLLPIVAGEAGSRHEPIIAPAAYRHQHPGQPRDLKGGFGERRSRPWSLRNLRIRRMAQVAGEMVTLVAPGVRATDTLIVSDLHLGLRTSRPDKLLETLRSWHFNRLILLGDIFHDACFGRFCAASWEVVRFIRELAQARGAEVVWLHGNHDRHLAPLIGKLTGIELRETFSWTVDGKSYLAVHGDRFDFFNHHFTRLGILIGRVYAFALHHLSINGHWPHRLDDWQVRKAGLHRRVAKRAAAFAIKNNVDYIVCGHTHRPGKRQFHDPRRGNAVTYVNAGCWVDLPASFLTIDAAGVEIKHAW